MITRPKLPARPRLPTRPERPFGRLPALPTKPHSLLQSFNFAIEGVIHVLRRERNMRFHFALATVVLVLAFTYDVTKLELSVLLMAIAFVMFAEMINTAVEEILDYKSPNFDPRAKIAKDVSAGAVLIASVTAATIGYLIFVDRIRQPTYHLLNEVRAIPANLTIIALAITTIAVIATKALTGRGTPLRGGLPSGHAALAFGGWMAITFVTADFQHRVLISTLSFLMAFLVAQTRVEAGIHKAREVFLGGILGTLVTLLLFQLLT